MRTKRTRVRPCAPRRRGRSPWTHRHGMVRHQSARRRGLYGRRAVGPQLSFSKSWITAIAVAVVVLAVADHLMVHRDIRAAGAATGPAGAVAGQFIYTARTANDAAITLPGVVKGRPAAGRAGSPVDRAHPVGYTGTVSTSYIDMTHRTGNSSQDHVLKVAASSIPNSIHDIRGGTDQTCKHPTTLAEGGRAVIRKARLFISGRPAATTAGCSCL